MKLVIDRSRWLRGADGMLLDEHGCMCCLGFLAKRCGAEDSQIKNYGTPAGAQSVAWPAWALSDNGYTDAISSIMFINDDEERGDAVRERELIEAFAKHGITVEFVDSVEPTP